MADVTISSLSKEYIRVPISAKEAGVVVNPTTDTVEMAFMSTDGEPAGGDWKSGSWETDTAPNPDRYYARCLVGPTGTIELANGRYSVWVRVTDAPEVPIRRVGVLQVT